MFYDIDNEEILYWNESTTIPISREPAHLHKKAHLRPNLVLPDAAHQQLHSLSSAVKVRQKDAESQKKLKHTRYAEQI